MPTLKRWLGSLAISAVFVLAGCSEGTESETQAQNVTSSHSQTNTSSEPASRDEPVTWRFGLEEITGSVQDAYAEEFKKRIEKSSDGTIRVEIYPYGTLGTSSKLTEIVREANVELAFASPGHLAKVIPEVGIFTLHFVLSDDNSINKQVLASDELHDLLSEPYGEKGLKLLGIIPEGEMVWTANKPLETLEDFRDFKMRTMTSPIVAQAYEAYGAHPAQMPYSEVYSGLQLKQIDGQVNPVFAIEEMSFHEVQDVMTMARHAQFISTVISNKTWYDSLPDQQKQWLNDVRERMVDFIYEKQAEYNDQRLEQIKNETDTEIVHLSDAQREPFREASMGVREIYIENTGERGRQLLDFITRRIDELGSGEQNTSEE
ncbi:TRAP transporter substrate-binding protein DctP [Marinobacter salicampi]|uniref:TRAP transporter substrate-binding protein n=1 Tax=Marinobacter salicampi TaxID=435907 RepID=UPI00140BE3B4|nr:TRAP transporter substrate-binding protein DctP [Marinobacter salicampi]